MIRITKLMKPPPSKSNLFLLGALFGLIFLTGCAGMQFDHNRGAFYPTQMAEASRAVEAARAAGKDKQFPKEFKEIEKMKNDAYTVYWACHTKEGIAMADEAASRARALLAKVSTPPAPTVSLSARPNSVERGQCSTLSWSSTNASSASINPQVGSVPVNGSRQVCPGSTTQYTIMARGGGGSQADSATVSVTSPPPPPPPAPTVSLSARPDSVERGQCSTLSWSSTNASSASINPQVGNVPVNGSQRVCPRSTTQYTIMARGGGGSQTDSVIVGVTSPPPPPPPPPAPAPRVLERLTIHVNFNFDKSTIRPADVAELQKAVAFVERHPDSKVSIEGHTDSIGTDAYNMGLSERRAAAVKAYLLSHGVTNGQRITTKGYGETRPIASNKTAQGRFENRRVEILILSR